MNERRKPPRWPLFLLLALAHPVAAQIQTGPLKLDMNGTATFGYTGDYGSLTSSDHGLAFGGNADLTGSYYSPNFLNFNIMPFYNQSRENSNFQSISDSSGINASTSIFGGSYFPGSVSYYKSYNSQGNFNVPGVTDYTSHGDSQVFSLGWSENVPKAPSLSFSFQDGTNHYSLYGASGDIASSYRSFGVQSSYSALGFNLNGSYHYTTTQSTIPDVFGATESQAVDSQISSYSFGLGHSLPFHGSFSAGASRSYITAHSAAGTYSATLDTVNSGVSFSPVEDFHFGTNLQYTDNLAAELEQTVLPAGGSIAGPPQESTHALDVSTFANYSIPSLHLVLNATDEYRQEDFLGRSLSADDVLGSVSYGNSVWGGFLNATAGVIYNIVSSNNQNMLGAFGALNFSRDIGAWSVSATGNYSRNTQTLLIAYTNSGYGYSGTLARRFGRKWHWSGSASGAKSVINSQAASGSFSQSYSTLLAVKWIGLSGSYSRSSGSSILTSAGLTPITIPLPVVTPSSVILYGGRAYSAGIGLTPLRGLTFSASYSRALSDTQGNSISTNNRTEQFNAFLQYQVRKIYLTSGYSRLSQSFSASGTAPGVLGAYYFGISRWFQFF